MDGTYVLAGCITSAKCWKAFSEEWQKMLPQWGTLNSYGQYHFKMSEMNANPERMERVPAFFGVIEKHVIGFVSVKINISDLKRARRRLVIPNMEIIWDEYADPFYIACRCLLDMFHLQRKEMSEIIPLDEKIDFYFDEQSQKNHILKIWENYIKNRPEEIRKLYGEKPRFLNDNYFLPLQAADLWAWWVRKFYQDGTPENINKLGIKGFKSTGKKLLRISISFDEEQLVTSLKKSLQIALGSNQIIYDVNLTAKLASAS